MLVAILVGCSDQNAQADDPDGGDIPSHVSIVGASSGGTFFLVANGMAQLFNDEMSSGQYSAQSTAGTPAIYKALDSNDGDIGFGQSSMAYDAINGEGQFEGNEITNMLGMTYMYPNAMHLVVSKSSGIKTPEDIQGKRIGVGEPGGGVEVDSTRLLEALGIDMSEDISAEYVTGGQATDMMRNNQLDGAIMPGGIGASNIVDILSTGEYELVPFSAELVDKVMEVNPAYFPLEIPANTYPNQTESIDIYAEANWLFARADLSEDFVYEMLTVLYDNQDYMITVHNSSENMTLENSQNGSMIPLHPGAIKFFLDNGVDID